MTTTTVAGLDAAVVTETTEPTATTVLPVPMLDQVSGLACAPGKVWQQAKVPINYEQNGQAKFFVALGWGCGADLEPPAGAVAATTTTLPKKGKKP